MAADQLNALVTQRVEVSPGLVILRVVPDGWELPDFTPGQFTVLALPASAPRHAVSDEEEALPNPERLIKRAYSIASSSVAKEYMEFYLALVPSGALTPRLFALQPGDRVFLSPKATGMFTLADVPEGKNVAFIGTGTGLAPYMSMLRTSLTCGGSTHLAVIHGARHSWDLGYRSELTTLDRMCGNFAYVPGISRPDEEPIAWGGATGRIQELWTSDRLEQAWGFAPDPEHTHVFLCGNPAMIESMLEILEGQGFKEHTKKEAGQIHVEKYW